MVRFTSLNMLPHLRNPAVPTHCRTWSIGAPDHPRFCIWSVGSANSREDFLPWNIHEMSLLSAHQVGGWIMPWEVNTSENATATSLERWGNTPERCKYVEPPTESATLSGDNSLCVCTRSSHLSQRMSPYAPLKTGSIISNYTSSLGGTCGKSHARPVGSVLTHQPPEMFPKLQLPAEVGIRNSLQRHQQHLLQAWQSFQGHGTVRRSDENGIFSKSLLRLRVSKNC